FERVEFAFDRSGMGEETDAGLRELNPTAVAKKQAGAERLFQLCNADRKGRLRDVHLLGGPREISSVHDRQEVPQLIAINH
ncbi:MAG TPA: hypothetical protein VJU34_07875, partial [Phenylobacterium sp.]|nr:hypothetical protein [Phenylobacterium sp.]